MSAISFSRRHLIGGSAALAGLMTLPANAAGRSERLKVTRVELFQVAVPFKDDVVNSHEYAVEDLARWGADALEMVDKTPKIIVKVHTDSGLVGLGESGRGAPLADAQSNAAYLQGKNVLDLNIPRLDLPGARTKFAFEMACYDLVGKAIGWPVYQLLGGLAQERVAVNYWCGRKNGADVVRVAQRTAQGGFKVLKMKCHSHTDRIVETVSAVAKTAPHVRVNVDFNTEYENAEAFLPLGRELEAIGNMHTFEDPIPTEDLAGFAKLKQALKTPLSFSAGTPRRIFEAGKADACSYINTGPNPGTTGFGINAAAAGALGIPVWHGSGCELGLLDAHFIHTCAAAANCTLPSDILSFLRVHSLLAKQLRFKDGYADVPRGPGLGVELDEDAVKRFRYRA